jgi:hypothetical protein
MKNFLSILPTQSLICFLLCGAGIVAFVFLIIIPNNNAGAELDREIEKINERIEQQRILRPVFDSLLQRAKKKNPTELPTVKKGKLERDDIKQVSDLLQNMAARHQLQIRDIQTDVNEIMKNTGFLLMQVQAVGDFMKFRDFLLDLGTIPALEQVEEINVQAIAGAREYRLKIWLASQ